MTPTQFRLLGAVKVCVEGIALPDTEPRRRALLAALLMDVGQVVPVGTLVDRVWGEQAPSQAAKTLASHVTRLRGVLAGTGEPVRIAYESGGYRLTASRDQVDLHRFRGLVAATRKVPVGEQLDLLRTAMALWQGEPLAGVAGSWAEQLRGRLVDERLAAAADWAMAEVSAGNAVDVLAMVGDLADAHPMAESLTLATMEALLAMDRPTEALERCRTHRRRLAEEYGTDQGVALRQRYQEVLRADAPPRHPARTAAPVPAQLPPQVRGFTGRDAEQTQLDAFLAPVEDHGDVVTVVVLTGTAGVGKTSLAVHWAHRIAAGYPDGQLHLNLRGYDASAAALEPKDALPRFLSALAVSPDQIPADPDDQAALYRSVLAGRRVLVLLDNARDAAQVRPLIPAARGCLVVVTSRNQLTGLVAEGAHLLPVDLLGPEEARRLIARRLDPARVAAEPDAVASIVASCAGLPLALSLAAAHAAIAPTLPLQALATQLRDEGQRWHRLAVDGTSDVRAVLSWSYRALSASAARLFRQLALHPGAEASASAAASLAGSTIEATLPVLRELVSGNLLQELRPGRYSTHDLLRAYGAELAAQTDAEPDRQAALQRVLDHYVHTIRDAQPLVIPRPPLALPPPAPGVTLQRHSDSREALAWLEMEQDNLMATVDFAARAGFDASAWQLAWYLAPLLDNRGFRAECLAVARLGEEAASRLADPVAELQIGRVLGVALMASGQLDEAEQLLRGLVARAQRHGERALEAKVRYNLSFLAGLRGDPHAGLTQLEQVLSLERALGNPREVALCLNAMAYDRAQLGDAEEAVQLCQESLALLEKAGSGPWEMNVRDTLGFALHQLGRLDEAAETLQTALALAREAGNLLLQLTVLLHLGDCHHTAGRSELAEECWTQALQLAGERDDLEVEQLKQRLAPA